MFLFFLCFAHGQPVPPPISTGTPVFNKNKAPQIVSVIYSESHNYKEKIVVEAEFYDVDGEVIKAVLQFVDSEVEWVGQFDSITEKWFFEGYISTLGRTEFCVSIEDDENSVTTSNLYDFNIEVYSPKTDQVVTFTSFSDRIEMSYIDNDINTEFLEVELSQKDSSIPISKKKIDVIYHQKSVWFFDQLDPVTDYTVRVKYCNRYVCAKEIYVNEISTTRLLPMLEFNYTPAESPNDWCNQWGDISVIDVSAENLIEDIMISGDSNVRISRDKIQWWNLQTSYCVDRECFDDGAVAFYVQCKEEKSGTFSHEVKFKFDVEFEHKVIVIDRLVKPYISQTEFEVTRATLDGHAVLNINWDSKNDLKDYDGQYLIISKSPNLEFDPNKYHPNGDYYVAKYSSDIRTSKIVPPFRSKKVYLKVIPFNLMGDNNEIIEQKNVKIDQVFSGLYSYLPEIQLYGGGLFDNKQWAFGICIEKGYVSNVLEEISIKLFDVNGEELDVLPISKDYILRSSSGMSVLLPPLMDRADRVSVAPCSVALFYKEILIEYQRFGSCKAPDDPRLKDVVPSIPCFSDDINGTIDDKWFFFITSSVNDQCVTKVELCDLSSVRTYVRRISLNRMVWQGKVPLDFSAPENWLYHKKMTQFSDVFIPSHFESVYFDEQIITNDLIYTDKTHLYGVSNLTSNQYMSCRKNIIPKQWHYICPANNMCNISQWEPTSGALYIKKWDGEWIDLESTDSLDDAEGYIIYSTKAPVCVENCSTLGEMSRTHNYVMDNEDDVSQWTLIGNPIGLYQDFPNDIENFTTSYIYVFDPIKPGYQVYGKGKPSLDEEKPFNGIAPNQAFFVEQLDDGCVTWDLQTAKLHSKCYSSKKTNEYSITMKVFNQDKSQQDNVRIVLGSNFQDSFHLKEDATKLIYQKKGLPQIFTIVDGINLVIDQRRTRGQEVDFKVQCDYVGPIVLSIHEDNNISSDTHLWIEDVMTKQCWDMTNGDEIELYKNKRDQSAPFRLHIEFIDQNVPDLVRVEHHSHGVRIYSLTKDEKQISIFNVLGSKIDSFKLRDESDKTFSLSAGVYLLKVISTDGVYTSKFIVY
ncbi:T9SS type A sorting domain-containing protein [Prolixibacteraceae bacterium]|nr:T9SS type A sorting domain-containing protein [Prolixibacteraceae bacterium]